MNRKLNVSSNKSKHTFTLRQGRKESQRVLTVGVCQKVK